MMPLNARVAAIEGEKVTIALGDGQTFLVPMTAIEGSVQSGTEVSLLIVGLNVPDAGRQAIARDILNSLLKNS